MPMTVMNNNVAAMALGELNKNDNKLAKDLKKASTGTRITGAADGASDYAISEKMRVKIRGLSQDIENVQNGRSLLKTGMGGIDDIVDELRNLKELALNSCNDHNTDVDRGILQKEFDARKAHIDNVAIDTNYNGIVLLDGRWSRFIEASDYEGETVNIVSQNTDSSATKDNVNTETLAPVTIIKTIVSPKKVTTDVKVETVDKNPGETIVTEVYNPVTTTESVTSTEGPTVKIISQNKTLDEESITKDGNRTTIVTDETITSTKVSTTSKIVTDTTTTTAITTTKMPSVKEISSTTPKEPIIIKNGTTSIAKDGLYEFAPDYTGTLSVSAKNVQLNGPKSGATLKNVYLKDTGVENLYIKNFKTNNNQPTSSIEFDSSSNNTLHLLGSNNIYYDNDVWDNYIAVVNAGGGLSIVGGGSIDIESNSSYGAIIGSAYGENCGNISIGQKVNINITNYGTHKCYGAGIGSGGYGGGCGNITIGTDANININFPTDMTGGACIGAGSLTSGKSGTGNKSRCGNIIIYSGANISVKANSGAGIGLGERGSGCGNITIYSNANVEAISKKGAGIGFGYEDRNSYIGDITIYSYPGDIVAKANDPNAEDIGKGAVFTGETSSMGAINLLSESSSVEGGILDLSELSLGSDTETKYEVTTTTITTTEVTKTISETKTTTIETYDEIENRKTTTVYEEMPEEVSTQKLGNPLIIHTGTKANQNLLIYIEDMRLEALGIKDTLIDPLEKAKESLEIIDAAIDYALDQATTLGAYYNELEFTESNLTSANENTVASESVIRDADMARVMLNYTKNNILSQAAQSMLSHSNQNVSSVLSLLQ